MSTTCTRRTSAAAAAAAALVFICVRSYVTFFFFFFYWVPVRLFIRSFINKCTFYFLFFYHRSDLSSSWKTRRIHRQRRRRPTPLNGHWSYRGRTDPRCIITSTLSFRRQSAVSMRMSRTWLIRARAWLFSEQLVCLWFLCQQIRLWRKHLRRNFFLRPDYLILYIGYTYKITWRDPPEAPRPSFIGGQ